jgi:hypothetical protein
MILKYNTSDQAHTIYDQFVSTMKNNGPATGEQFLGDHDIGGGAALFHHVGTYIGGETEKRMMVYKDQFVIGMIWLGLDGHIVEDSMMLQYAEIQASKIN